MQRSQDIILPHTHIRTLAHTHLRTLAYTWTLLPSCGYKIITLEAFILRLKAAISWLTTIHTVTLKERGSDIYHLTNNHNYYLWKINGITDHTLQGKCPKNGLRSLVFKLMSEAAYCIS